MSRRKPGVRATRKATSKPKAKPKLRAAFKSRAASPDGGGVAQDLCQQVLSGETITEAEVSLAFADDETLRKLNAQYRDMDRTTDVLAFTYDDNIDEDGNRFLSGELYVSVPRIIVQAKRYKVSPGRELARLITHGCLHLCGHDHKKVGERKIMRAREKVHMDALRRTDETALTKLVRSWSAELV